MYCDIIYLEDISLMSDDRYEQNKIDITVQDR